MYTGKDKKCSRCGKGFHNWEDESATGRLYLEHSSVIGDLFAEGARISELSEKRSYIDTHPAVKFGSNPHQSLLIEYGGDNKYLLCWECSRKLMNKLGAFFTIKEVPKCPCCGKDIS